MQGYFCKLISLLLVYKKTIMGDTQLMNIVNKQRKKTSQGPQDRAPWKQSYPTQPGQQQWAVQGPASCSGQNGHFTD